MFAVQLTIISATLFYSLLDFSLLFRSINISGQMCSSLYVCMYMHVFTLVVIVIVAFVPSKQNLAAASLTQPTVCFFFAKTYANMEIYANSLKFYTD